MDGRDAIFLVSLLQFAAPRLSLLDAKASKNLDSPMAAVAHMWSVGKRCLKQTFCLQVLHSYVMENVSISLQLFTGHLGLITFFVTSQLPNLTWSSRIFSSSSSALFFSITREQILQTTTTRLLSSAFEQACST